MLYDAPGLPAHKTSGYTDPFIPQEPDPSLQNLDHAQEEAEEFFYLSQLEDGWSVFHGGKVDTSADYLNAFLYQEELIRSGQGNSFQDDWDDMQLGYGSPEFFEPLEEDDPFDPFGGF